MTYLYYKIQALVQYKLQAIDLSLLVAAYFPIHFTWVDVNHALATISALASLGLSYYKYRQFKKKNEQK